MVCRSSGILLDGLGLLLRRHLCALTVVLVLLFALALLIHALSASPLVGFLFPALLFQAFLVPALVTLALEVRFVFRAARPTIAVPVVATVAFVLSAFLVFLALRPSVTHVSSLITATSAADSSAAEAQRKAQIAPGLKP